MIYLKELLPNPIGKDMDGEWIKLFNDDSSSVVLNGWTLKDAGEKVFRLDGQTVPASGDLKLTYNETRITLNNDAESIYLLDASGKEIDKLSYNEIIEGQIITAAKFQVVPAAGTNLSSTAQGIPVTGFNFRETYDLWPIALGLFLAIFSGLVSVHIFKLLRQPADKK